MRSRSRPPVVNLLADAREAFDRLATLPMHAVSPASVLDEWDRIAIALENIEGPIAILNNVHPDKAVRDAADDAVRQLARFQVEIFQNEALFARVSAVQPGTPIEAQFRKDLVEAFEDTGVSLAPDRRARTKAIAERVDGALAGVRAQPARQHHAHAVCAGGHAGPARRVSLAAAARRGRGTTCSRSTTRTSTRSWPMRNRRTRGAATTPAT